MRGRDRQSYRGSQGSTARGAQETAHSGIKELMAAKHAEKHQARKVRTIEIASDESAITIEDQSKEELSRKSTIEAALQSASPINEDDAYSYVNTSR